MAGCSVCQAGNIDGGKLFFTATHQSSAVDLSGVTLCFVNSLMGVKLFDFRVQMDSKEAHLKAFFI